MQAQEATRKHGSEASPVGGLPSAARTRHTGTLVAAPRGKLATRANWSERVLVILSLNFPFLKKNSEVMYTLALGGFYIYVIIS